MSDLINTAQLNALYKISHTINSHLDLDKVLKAVMNVATMVMKVEASSLVLIDEETGDLLFHVTEGEKAEIIKQIIMKSGQGIVGAVVQTQKPTIVNDVSKDPRFFKFADKKSGFQTKSILCVPMNSVNRNLGAIEVLNKLDETDFNDQDLIFLEAIANQASVAIENAKLHKSIVKNERMAAIGQTVSGLVHCIKNVLNGIQGGSFIVDLGLKKEDSSKIQKGWDIVKKNNIFMQDLMLDMLSYSKERKPEYAITNISEINESVCNLMEQKAKEKGVTITCVENLELNEVEIDPNGIKRCILNLVSNAVDACEKVENAQINVSSESISSKYFKIDISDNGTGMSPEVQKKLFQVFFSTKGSKGTGLGLVVTHKIIKEHGGNIKVNSKEGEGTTFTIILPKKKKKEQ
ncbi:MAG: GAF domain-containing sensor histidine kinase [Candidatus Cloacimonetes bacterium]|nr:GAF domain-containing sensor histidine kinase [Candidatus Cloacimonadota bacterium]